MTAEQLLAVATTATDMLTNSGAPAPEPVVEAVPAATEFDIPDTEYLTGADFKRALAARKPDTTAITMAADTNLAFIQGQYASEFAKYGAELNGYLARVPVAQRTIDNLRMVVKMVQANHVDEIAEERAQQRLSTLAPTLRPTGGGSAPAPVTREFTLESEKIPQEWKDRARAAKITENTVAEFCAANGMTPADFYKQFDTPMNRIIEDVSVRVAR